MKKRIKKLLSCLLVVVFVVALMAGCSGGGEETAEDEGSGGPVAKDSLLEGKRIIYIVNSEKTDWQIISNHYLEELCKAAGADITVHNPDGDSSTQAQMLEDALVQQPDLIFMKPLDQASIVPAVKKANEAGIPIVTLDFAVSGEADCKIDCAVQTDQYSCGELAAEYFKKVADETGVDQVVIEVYGDMSTNIGQQRGPDSFDKAVEGYDNVELVAATESKWDASDAYTAVMDMLTAHPEANAIYSHSDCMSSGIVQALTDLGRLVPAGEEGHVTYVSVDGEAIGCQHIREGWIDQIADNNPAKNCIVAFWAAIDILNGYEVPEVLTFPSFAITPENVDEAWGSMDINDIASWGWYETDAYELQTPYVE